MRRVIFFASVLVAAFAIVVHGGPAGLDQGRQGRGGRGGGAGQPTTTYVLKPARVFDGEAMHERLGRPRARPAHRGGRRADRQRAGAGRRRRHRPRGRHAPAWAHRSALARAPSSYNENELERSGRARASGGTPRRARDDVAQEATTLDAGFTTIRDLGTEGAGYSDVGGLESRRSIKASSRGRA